MRELRIGDTVKVDGLRKRFRVNKFYENGDIGVANEQGYRAFTADRVHKTRPLQTRGNNK